jgi:hypothetical protein
MSAEPVRLDPGALVVSVGAAGPGKATCVDRHVPVEAIVGAARIRQRLAGDATVQDLDARVAGRVWPRRLAFCPRAAQAHTAGRRPAYLLRPPVGDAGRPVRYASKVWVIVAGDRPESLESGICPRPGRYTSCKPQPGSATRAGGPPQESWLDREYPGDEGGCSAVEAGIGTSPRRVASRPRRPHRKRNTRDGGTVIVGAAGESPGGDGPEPLDSLGNSPEARAVHK